MKMKHKFTEHIPEKLEDNLLYISISYDTMVHKCCCGCGSEVVTPLSPTDWKLMYNGDSISLFPSIGNWGFPCQSHYWIKNNKIEWAGKWSNKEIEEGRRQDHIMKKLYYGDFEDSSVKEPQIVIQKKRPWLTRILFKLFKGK